MTTVVARPRAHTSWTIARCVAAIILVTGVAVSFAFIGTARAATTLGALRFSPATGTDLSAVTVETTAACPSQAKNILAKVYGPGFPADGKNVVGNTAISAFDKASTGSGLSVPLQSTLRFFANSQAKPFNLVGTYRVVVTCRLPFGTSDFGEFAGTLTFDSTSKYVAEEPAVVPSASSSSTGSTSTAPAATGEATAQAGSTASGTTSPAPATSAPATSTAATHHSGSGKTSLVIGIAVAAGVLLAAWLLSTFRRSPAQSGRRRSS
jgi:hypothetical protein